MRTAPKIAPLHLSRDIYGIWDERNKLIGTGTKEVCEVLLYLITQHDNAPSIPKLPELPPRQMNVKSAISI